MDVTVDECFMHQEKFVFIDVRSPSEYEEATIPGSLNIPIFDDEERAKIGTLYKQVSKQAAMDAGLEIVSAKLPTFIKQFSNLQGRIVVFCWRGGMRSKTTATLLSLMNIHAQRLVGGYRAYRQWIVHTLENIEIKPTFVVLHGNTGTGKTAILKKLQAKGYPVLDLEAFASHRGSIFGEIGKKSHNQKTFDALLVTELLRLNESPYILIEAESNRIGKVVLPECLIKKKNNGHCIQINLPIEARIQTILEDYEPWNNQEQCLTAFRKIKSRLHTPIATEIEQSLVSGEFKRAVELLLVYYYDPRYDFTASQLGEEVGKLNVKSVDEAVALIERMVELFFPSLEQKFKKKNRKS